MARWSKANSTSLSDGEPPTGDRLIRPMWAFSSIVPQKWGGGFAFSLAMQKSAVRCTKKGRPNIHQQKHARVGPGQSDVTGTKRALRLITPRKRGSTLYITNHKKGIAPVQLPPGRPKIEHLVEHRAGERPLFRVFGKQPHGGLKNAPPCRESGMWKFHTGLVTHKKPVTSGEA